MTPICTCRNAVIIDNPGGGGKYCKKCKCWWDQRYGSLLPGEKPQVDIDVGAPPKSVYTSTQRVAKIRINRNDPCICGSGKKFKHCCLNK